MAAATGSWYQDPRWIVLTLIAAWGVWLSIYEKLKRRKQKPAEKPSSDPSQQPSSD